MRGIRSRRTPRSRLLEADGEPVTRAAPVAGQHSQLQSTHVELALPALWIAATRSGPMLGMSPLHDVVRVLPPLPDCRLREDRLLRPRQAASAAHGSGGACLLGAGTRRNDPTGGCSGQGRGSIGSPKRERSLGSITNRGRPRPTGQRARPLVRAGLRRGPRTGAQPVRGFYSITALGAGPRSEGRRQQAARRQAGTRLSGSGPGVTALALAMGLGSAGPASELASGLGLAWV